MKNGLFLMDSKSPEKSTSVLAGNNGKQTASQLPVRQNFRSRIQAFENSQKSSSSDQHHEDSDGNSPRRPSVSKGISERVQAWHLKVSEEEMAGSRENLARDVEDDVDVEQDYVAVS